MVESLMPGSATMIAGKGGVVIVLRFFGAESMSCG